MTYGKRPPLDEEKALFESQVAREGVTTGPGAVAGNSLVDAGLIGFGANSFFSMLAIVYPGQPNLVDSFDITAFNSATGEVTLSHNYKGGQIPTGVPYKIVTFRFVPAEVAAIEAKLDLPVADGLLNTRIAEIVGRKDDSALYAVAATASLMRYIKALVTSGIAVPGAVSDAGPAITDFDTNLAEATDDHYNGMLLMFIDGPNAGQAHTIDDYAGAAKNVRFRVGDQWTDVPVNGNSFVILPSAALYTVAANSGFQEQPDVAFNVDAVLAAETDILHLAAANTRYIVRSLRLKCVDPGGETITVRLYELVNGGVTEVDSFTIAAANFATYHSLMDMFGLPHLAGDELQVTVQATAAGPYAVTGQYSWASAT